MVKSALSVDGIVVDIGNSDFKYAIISQGEICSVHRTKQRPSLNPYKVPIVGSSVVPKRKQRMDNHKKVYWIDQQDIPIKAPHQVGVDRLIALYAAKTLYKAETVLVIDVGTFLTFSVLYQNEFAGGYIIPGPHTMMMSYSCGAQLYKHPFWSPYKKGMLPQETLDAMQAGTTEILQRGVASLIADIKSQYPHILVVGTGGMAFDLLRPITDVAIINPTLILEGLVGLAEAKELF